MAFDSFYEFLKMGGYAPYVWSAFGIGFFILITNVLSPLRKKQSIIKEIKSLARIKQQANKTSQPKTTQI